MRKLLSLAVHFERALARTAHDIIWAFRPNGPAWWWLTAAAVVSVTAWIYWPC